MPIDFDTVETGASTFDFDAPSEPEPAAGGQEADDDSPEFVCTDFNVPVKDEAAATAREDISGYQAGTSRLSASECQREIIKYGFVNMEHEI